jgi:protein-L-isoaspartate(D-aspartate) O-methyltransferase
VVAAEVDPELAALADEALRSATNVEVHHADGTMFDPGQVDAMLVNAGVTHVLPLWLDRLRDGGRLLVPITHAPAPGATSTGVMLRVQREGETFRLRTIGPVAIFASAGGRSAQLNDQLRTALASGGWRNLRTVRRDLHQADETCWLHSDAACLSMRE